MIKAFNTACIFCGIIMTFLDVGKKVIKIEIINADDIFLILRPLLHILTSYKFIITSLFKMTLIAFYLTSKIR
jgi:hypothetical protein